MNQRSHQLIRQKLHKERKTHAWKSSFPVSPVIVLEGVYLVKSLSTFPNEPLSVAARTQWPYKVLKATLKSQGKWDPLDVMEEESLLGFSRLSFTLSVWTCLQNEHREPPRYEKIKSLNKFIEEKEITLTVDTSYTV